MLWVIKRDYIYNYTVHQKVTYQLFIFIITLKLGHLMSKEEIRNLFRNLRYETLKLIEC